MKVRQYIRILRWPLIMLFIISIVGGTMGARSRNSSGTRSRTRGDKSSSSLLIDDFSLDLLAKKVSTGWEFVSDRAMGGHSVGKMEFGVIDGRSCLHLIGSVSPENNNGFIQVQTTLGPKGRNFDAYHYKGVRLNVKGNGQSYAIYLRTRDTRMPYQFYEASFSTDGK